MTSCDENTKQLMRQIRRLTANQAILMSLMGQGQMQQNTASGSKLIMNSSTNPVQVPGACGGQQMCPPALVGPGTMQAVLSGPRTVALAIAIAGLAPGGFVDAVVTSNSIERTLVVTDLITSLANMDTVRVSILIGVGTGAREVDSFNGGKFSRANANTCVTACGYGACVGPIENLTIRVTNVTALAIAALSTMSVDIRSIYRGEDGFSCGDCITPGAPGQGPLPGGTFPYPGTDDSPVG